MRALFFGDVPHRIAGAQKSLLTAVLKGRAFGLEPTMVFASGGAFEQKCRDEGLRVRLLPGPDTFTVFGKALLRQSAMRQISVVVRDTLPYAREFARLVDEERAEVVHYNTARGMILAGWGAHLSGRNTVLHQRGSVAIGRPSWLVAQALTDRMLLVARALMSEVFPSMRPRTTVLYNGVNADLPVIDRAVARAAVAKKLEGKLALDEGTRLFVSLSSPCPFKGLHYLVEAAALVRDRGVRAAYVLAGEPKPGNFQAWLQRKIDGLGLRDTVVLLGFVEDTHQLLCAADALVLPSTPHERIVDGGEVYEDRSNEGLPRGILEAMVASIPSIASDIAGVSEQIEDGTNGLLVPPRDPARLADAIERIARDEAFRLRAGAAGREIARSRFRVEDAALGLVRSLREVAAEPSSIARKIARWPALAADALRAEG
jgi:glycosyltransferase involved in cell wall biosynthesis